MTSAFQPKRNPAQNGAKFFCTADILETLKDRSWLIKVTNTINQHWQRQNARKKAVAVNGYAVNLRNLD
jgi:hypothetical protein